MITQENKIRALKAVLYEISHLELCRQKLVQLSNQIRRGTNEDNCERASCLEAFLVHLRALKNFFEKPLPNPDNRDPNNLLVSADVLSEDYGFLSHPIGFNPNIKDRLDKQLAHITYHRQILPTEWHSYETSDVIRPIIIRFRDHLINRYPEVFDYNSAYYINGWLDNECKIYIEIVKSIS